MTTADVLTQAADLVSKGWTQGTAARDVNGRPVAAASTSAVQWCPWGAITRAADGKHQLQMQAEEALRRLLGHGSFIHEWNDTEGRTQLAVVRKLRAAAKRA